MSEGIDKREAKKNVKNLIEDLEKIKEDFEKRVGNGKKYDEKVKGTLEKKLKKSKNIFQEIFKTATKERIKKEDITTTPISDFFDPPFNTEAKINIEKLERLKEEISFDEKLIVDGRKIIKEIENDIEFLSDKKRSLKKTLSTLQNLKDTIRDDQNIDGATKY
jgi:hypothetical protein